jgi:hypothetical protein
MTIAIDTELWDRCTKLIASGSLPSNVDSELRDRMTAYAATCWVGKGKRKLSRVQIERFQECEAIMRNISKDARSSQ